MDVSLRFLDPVRPDMTLSRRRARIGRGTDNDIVLEDPCVAPLHAVLVQRDAELLLRDVSGEGVHVNRRRVYMAALQHGDLLRIGEHHLAVAIGPARQSARPCEDTCPGADILAEVPARRAVRLAVRIHHAHGWRVHPLSATPTYFGKGPGCDVVVHHPTVSRWHACLEVADGRAVLRDLCSKNGLRVSGVRVEHTPVEPNMEVALGDARLQFIHAADAIGLDPEPAPFEGLVGFCAAMRRLHAALEEVAPTDEPVLIQGETGSGKELVARAVHTRSRRSAGPFVAVNCGALPKDLAESELFGHERGAFSGAVALRRGYFEEANGGTLFLDEVVELPLEAQAKLLRVLESGELRRVGGDGARRVDVRIVAAANRSLRELVRHNRFRLDLFHRLCVAELHVPPLRQRMEDLPALTRHFLPPDRVLSADALRRLGEHPWPGNVRELRNVMRRAALRARGPVIEADHLALEAVDAPPCGHAHIFDKGALAQIEQQAIGAALEACGGNKTAAARRLGISRSALWDKMRRLRLAS